MYTGEHYASSTPHKRLSQVAPVAYTDPIDILHFIQLQLMQDEK